MGRVRERVKGTSPPGTALELQLPEAPRGGKEAKERGRPVIGGTLPALLIGSHSWLREAVVGRASRRSWEKEMEGCVSNLMVCNLAYSGKLEELKERILADKSLATRTDQVKQRWGLSGGGGIDEAQRGCLAWPKGGRFHKGQIPAPAAPSLARVTSGLGMGRQELAPQTSNIWGGGA